MDPNTIANSINVLARVAKRMTSGQQVTCYTDMEDKVEGIEISFGRGRPKHVSNV